MNGLGALARESGQRRVPDPPERISGTTVGLGIGGGQRTGRYSSKTPGRPSPKGPIRLSVPVGQWLTEVW
jgi:hypothetical protein